MNRKIKFIVSLSIITLNLLSQQAWSIPVIIDESHDKVNDEDYLKDLQEIGFTDKSVWKITDRGNYAQGHLQGRFYEFKSSSCLNTMENHIIKLNNIEVIPNDSTVDTIKSKFVFTDYTNKLEHIVPFSLNKTTNPSSMEIDLNNANPFPAQFDRSKVNKFEFVFNVDNTVAPNAEVYFGSIEAVSEPCSLAILGLGSAFKAVNKRRKNMKIKYAL